MEQNQQFKTLLIIYWAMFTSQIIFFLVAIWIVQNDQSVKNPDLFFIFLLITIVLVMPAIVIGPTIYRTLLAKSQNLKTVNEKLISYRQNTIIKLALVEAPLIFSVVSLIITGNYIFTLFIIIVLVLFVLHRPTKEKFAEDYRVSFNELDR